MNDPSLEIADLKRSFSKDRVLALAESEGLARKGGKVQCPRRCGTEPDSCSVFEKDGTVGWKCHRCQAGGDVFTLIESTRNVEFKEARAAVAQKAGIIRPKPGRKPTPPIEQLWNSLTDDDHAVRVYLSGRGLEGALDRGLVRCNVGRSDWWWLDRRARDGYRLAVALYDTSAQLFSMQLRSIYPDTDKAKLSLLGVEFPPGKLAMGAVEAARPAQRVYLCEGIADTLALQLAGVVAIGAPGVEFVAALPGFLGSISGREVVLCPQNDVGHTRARVSSEQAFAALRDTLRAAGARVLVLATPAEHKDPADWLRAVGIEAFTAAVVESPVEDVELAIGPQETMPLANDGSTALAVQPLAEVIALPKRFPLTDTGNAERLISQHGDDLRYCHNWDCWLIWDGKRWERDSTSEVMRLAKSTIRTMGAEIQREIESHRKNPLRQAPDDLKAIVEFAKKCESADKRHAMVAMARSEEAVSVVADTLDADPWLLNVSNGILDLQTGELEQPHRREALLTHLVPIAYDPEADCPRWKQFLHEIFLGDSDLIAFVRRAIGYSLTGATREQKFFLCYGTGENGKSVFLGILGELLGEYARTADFNTFASGEAAPGAPRPDLVRLRGARLVTAAEPDRRIHLSESRLKIITGEDAVTARGLHENDQEFRPVLKLWLMANHKPTVTDSSHGFRRRVALIPFNYQIPPEQKDPTLKQKLQAELPGILRWAADGCLEWRRQGLGVAKAVSDATQEYHIEMDPLGRFLAECCEMPAPGMNVSLDAMHGAYVKWWADESSAAPKSKNKLGRELRDRGFKDGRDAGGRFWRDVRLVSAATSAGLQ